MEIQKGTVNSYKRIVKYDDEGNEYTLFNVTIDGKHYTSKGPKGLHLKEGAAIVFETNGTEISSAFFPTEQTQWGKNIRKLKQQTGVTDKYTFMFGKVVEKRKETFLVNNNSNSDYESQLFNTATTFTVVLENGQFRTSDEYGKPLKPNDELAIVLEQGAAVLIKNLKTSQYIGWTTPYFIYGLIIFIILLNGSILYSEQNYPGTLANPSATYVILNCVFGLILITNISSHFGRRHLKKFMNQQLKANGLS